MCKFVQNRIVVAVAIQNLDVYLLSRSFSTESANNGRSGASNAGRKTAIAVPVRSHQSTVCG